MDYTVHLKGYWDIQRWWHVKVKSLFNQSEHSGYAVPNASSVGIKPKCLPSRSLSPAFGLHCPPLCTLVSAPVHIFDLESCFLQRSIMTRMLVGAVQITCACHHAVVLGIAQTSREACGLLVTLRMKKQAHGVTCSRSKCQNVDTQTWIHGLTAIPDSSFY